MNRLYKPILIISWLLLFGVFTSTSLGQAPVTPADASVGVSISTTSVSWTAFSDDIIPIAPPAYDVEFNGIDGTYATFVSSSSGQAGTSFAFGGPPLLFNTTYFWQVRDNEIAFGIPVPTPGPFHTFSFTTELAPPVLSSPADAAPGQDLNVLLSWGSVSGANQYTLEVNTDNTFPGSTAVAVIGQPQVGTSKAPGGLSDNMTYYWRVTASNFGTGNTSAASSVRSFTTTQQSVTGVIPEDDSVGVVLSPTLSWPTDPTGTDTYRLEVNTEVGFGGTIIFDDATLTTTSQQINGLSNGTEYFWRVTASSNLAKVNTSSVLSFITTTTQFAIPIWPANALTVFSLKPLFSWYVTNLDTNSLTYDIQLDDDSDFSSLVLTLTGLPGFTATSTLTLDPGTTYYWRVRTLNTVSGLYSSYSTGAEFITSESLSMTPVPVLAYPISNPTVQTTTPTLYWYLTGQYAGVTDITYTVEVDDDFGFGSNEFSTSGVTAQSVTTSALSPGTTYYWRVKTVSSGGTSAFSIIDTFTVVLGQGGAPDPVLSWPIGGVTVYSNTPTLYWYLSSSATGAITYDIDVDAISDAFGNIVVDEDGISDQFWTVTSSLDPGTYYWRVRTHNGGNTSPFVSTNGTFVVNASVETAPDPVLSWPIGGATVFSTTPVLYWYLSSTAPGGATIEYDIKVFSNSGLTSLVASTTGNSPQSWTVTSALVPPGTYYWQVRVNNTTAGTTSGYLPASGTSANSFVVSATASGVAVAPTPIYPTGNITVSTLTPTLSWFVNGVVPIGATYEVELKETSSDFDETGTASGLTSQTYTTGTLMAGTQYHWRVRMASSSSPNPSDWSDPVVTGGAKFTTAAALAPPPPLVGGPINGAMITNGQPDISWFLPTAPKTELMYKLQISEDASMNNIAFELDDIDAFHTVVNSLKGGTTYYWRVQSKDPQGVYSAHSIVSRFATGSVTAIDNELVIPQKFTLEQNYPNPFNPATTIRFALPEASFVTLKIYNILGQVVKTLVNEQKNAGTYNVQWRGDNDFGHKVSSGAYIYRVIAGQNIFTKKMVLLK